MTPSGATSRRIIIDLDPSEDSIHGSVHSEHSTHHEFHGWLELSTLLDNLRPRPLAPSPSASTAADPDD